MRVLLIISIATASIVVLMTHVGLILNLPRPYATLQFGFRLESYVLLGVSGAVLAVLMLMKDGARTMRLWRWLLAPILALSIAGAVEQVGAYKPESSRSIALYSYLTPIYEEEGLLDYVDSSLHYNPSRLPEVDFQPHGGHASVVVHLPPGQRIDTNIRASPDLVHVTGARIVGDDAQANDVLEVDPGDLAAKRPRRDGRPSARAETISVSPANSLPVVLGRVLTAIAVIALALQLVAVAVRSRARRSSGA
jgi:hypothetical protein